MSVDNYYKARAARGQIVFFDGGDLESERKALDLVQGLAGPDRLDRGAVSVWRSTNLSRRNLILEVGQTPPSERELRDFGSTPSMKIDRRLEEVSDGYCRRCGFESCACLGGAQKDV